MDKKVYEYIKNIFMNNFCEYYLMLEEDESFTGDNSKRIKLER